MDDCLVCFLFVSRRIVVIGGLVMMSMLEIKIFAVYYINEQENLTKVDKKILVDFVKNANKNQVLKLLQTGTMLHEANWAAEIPERAKGLFDFEKTTTDLARQSGSVEGMAIAAVIAGILSTAYLVYKRYLSKAAKACKDYKGVQRKECIAKFERMAIQAKITSISKGLSACAKSKDPAKCKAKLQSKIAAEKQKLGS
jgi:hypothetical protein